MAQRIIPVVSSVQCLQSTHVIQENQLFLPRDAMQENSCGVCVSVCHVRGSGQIE